jgi:TrmH family RNA methyltransferase
MLRGAISSAHNSRVAAARKLRMRKERRAAGAFLVEGARVCAEALSSGWQVRELFVTRDHDDLADSARARGVHVTVVDGRAAQALADTQHSQGAFAVVDIPAHDLATVLPDKPRLVVVLAGVADPGNAGTVIRTAAAAGADAVVMASGGVDPYGGKCVRASAGALFHVPVITDVDQAAAVDVLRSAGTQVLATALAGEDLFDLEPTLRDPTTWLFGSEAHGLDATAIEAADRRVRVPMAGSVESLNLAAAAAICLYASARAQHPQ